MLKLLEVLFQNKKESDHKKIIKFIISLLLIKYVIVLLLHRFRFFVKFLDLILVIKLSHSSNNITIFMIIYVEVIIFSQF
jgi:hypothetical protein